jgi:hypothetical protein
VTPDAGSTPASTEAGEAILAAARGIVAAAAAEDARFAGAELWTIGWATVDLDRAERELGQVLGVSLDARPAARARRLGATTRISHPFGQRPALLLLEPDTEGLLAALLARHGEGVVLAVVRAGGLHRLTLTTDPGERPPTVISGRQPSAAG